MKKIIIAISIILLPITINSAEVERTTKAIEVLSKDDGLAFKRFIEIYQIVSPHPDSKIQHFIDRAIDGDTDSFALISFFIWKGYAGFHKDPLSAKLAMMTAVNKGSAQAAYWIGQTFFQGNSESSEKEKLDNYISGIQWMGISAGMGEEQAHTYAMDAISKLSPRSDKTTEMLYQIYNQGLIQSKEYKKIKPNKSLK